MRMGNRDMQSCFFKAPLAFQEATCSRRQSHTPKSVAQTLKERFPCVFVAYSQVSSSVRARSNLCSQWGLT